MSWKPALSASPDDREAGFEKREKRLLIKWQPIADKNADRCDALRTYLHQPMHLSAEGIAPICVGREDCIHKLRNYRLAACAFSL